MPIHDETRLRALRFTGRANHLSVSQRTADSVRSITCGRRTILMTMTSSVESHSLWKVGRMRFHLPFHFTEKGRQSSSGPGTTDPGPTIIPATCLACEVRGGWGGGGDLSLFAFAPSRSCVRSRNRSGAAHRASDRLRPRVQYEYHTMNARRRGVTGFGAHHCSFTKFRVAKPSHRLAALRQFCSFRCPSLFSPC